MAPRKPEPPGAAAARKRKERERYRAKGLVRIPGYALPEHLPAIKAAIDQITAKEAT